jgi:hypothetical protein
LRFSTAVLTHIALAAPRRANLIKATQNENENAVFHGETDLENQLLICDTQRHAMERTL